MKYVTTTSAEEDSGEQFYIDRIGSDTSKPIMLELDVEGHKLDMELDTGAAFSIISECTCQDYFSDMPLHKSDI